MILKASPKLPFHKYQQKTKKMTIKKLCLTYSLTVLIAAISGAQTNFKTLVKDFQKMAGSWKGTLTYLDYSSGKPYTMPADVDIKRIKNTNTFVFSNFYPNERNANSIDTITISANGKYIDKELVKSKRKLLTGDFEIVTVEMGKDGNDDKPATIRHTYIVGKKIFKKRKDIQFIGETEWINRHEYAYTKNSGS
jgi:hypothetical protein